ncbi:hypothetical protein OROMI_019485 [Orobanche minor]
MSSYAKFLKDILANKRKLEEHETVMLTEESSAIIQQKLPPKLKDPGTFTVPCTIGKINCGKALCDLGASINLMPLSIFQKLNMGEAKATTVSLQLADRSIKYPRGIIEDVLIKVDKFIFPADFIIIDMEEDQDIPIILGRPFLATGRAIINVEEGKLILRIQDEHVVFNILKTSKNSSTENYSLKIDAIKAMGNEPSGNTPSEDPPEPGIVNSLLRFEKECHVVETVNYLETQPTVKKPPNFESGSSSTKPSPSLGLIAIEKRYPYLSKKMISKIYKSRLERMRLLMNNDIPFEIRLIIEAKVRIEGEFTATPTRFLPGLGKSIYAQKRRAKKLGICYKCARWNCEGKCRSLGIPSTNREDKIQFIKNGLNKENFDDIKNSLDTHPSGLVHYGIRYLWDKFQPEYERRLGNLTLKDPVCQFVRKLDGKLLPDS